MRIGIMLRHFNQPGGGVKNYTNNLLDELLSLESEHEFVLIYNNPKWIGTYKHCKNVREISLNISSRLLWDQIGIPWIQRKEKIDLIFNPKLTLPLLINCPAVFTCHGLNSYLMPWGAKRSDAFHQKYIYPRYVSKASFIIAVSDTAKEHMIKFLGTKEEKLQTVYLGISDIFKEKLNRDESYNIKLKYNLPERFFLFVGQIYPPKNFGRLLQAYAKVGPQNGVYLVVAGEPRWLFNKDIKMIDKLGISDWVINAGWVEHQELRYFYSLAAALILPSLYEACPSPILEAMATQCPIITANRYGTKELAGEAGILVDPEEIESIADGMKKIVDANFSDELVKIGYSNVQNFSWRKCAEETLKVFEKAYTMKKVKRKSIKVFRNQGNYKQFIIHPPK